MKLNTKRTILTGLAFLSICAFWQMYDNVVPIILTETFHLNETWSGAIMAVDNLLALFLLPFFGTLSDKCRSPMGKRMPFILFGTASAAVLMNILPRIDNSYYAAPAQGKMLAFVATLGLLLIAMGTYRSPAVALMPDLTPKPLRSKANAIINLMGAIGGVLYLILASVLYSGKRVGGLEHVDYSLLFAVVSGIMILAVAVLKLTINENKMRVADQPEEKAEAAATQPDGRMAPEVKRSLGFLLCSICLWFVGYNAITTWFTTYASRVWDMALGDSSLCLTVATVGAILSYIPVGNVATKVGRKKTISFGVVLLSSCFFMGFVFSKLLDGFSPILYVLFAMVGLAWASINVNSLPMVVEMCSGKDIGKFTGYYYTFSMSAQSITPILAGWIMNNFGYQWLFPYAAFFVACAFFTMRMVRHGDAKVEAKKGLEAFDVEE